MWEYYAGQGIEIQWLGTFGEANGYYLSGHENANLRQLLGEVLPLATKRAGGHRLGVHVPASTAARRRGRAGSRRAPPCRCSRARGRASRNPRCLTAAQQALGIFQTPPADRACASRRRPARDYAEYTYAPSDRILNGFIQARRRALRLHLDHQGPARAEAVRSRRRRGARRGRRTTTPAPGRCTTSSANRTSTTTNC